MAKKRILINMFHPDLSQSRGNRILAEAVRDIPGVTFRHVSQELGGQAAALNVAHEQDLLLQHDLIVFQHPFYWYSCPPLMKEWEDKVLARGFAYPPGSGDKLKGKHWLTVITTGGPQMAYRSGGFNNFTISELLRPFQQTANLCGMIWLPPIVVHSVLPEGIGGLYNVTDDELRARAAEYRAFMEGFEG